MPKAPFKLFEELRYSGHTVLFLGIRSFYGGIHSNSMALVRFPEGSGEGWDYADGNGRSEMCHELRNRLKCFGIFTGLYWVNLSILKRSNNR